MPNYPHKTKAFASHVILLLLHKQLITFSSPGACGLPLSIIWLFFHSSAFCSLFTFCLLSYSLIFPLPLSVRWLCVEFKPQKGRMSFGVVFPPLHCDPRVLLVCTRLFQLNLATADQYPVYRDWSLTPSISVHSCQQINNNDPTSHASGALHETGHGKANPQ